MKKLHLINILIIPLLFLLLAACKGPSGKDRPELFLSLDKMVEVTTDIQLVEAALNYRRNIGQEYHGKREEYFALLFEKHGLSRHDYEENVVYYNRRPADMELIYDRVLQNLEALQRDLNSKEEGEEK